MSLWMSSTWTTDAYFILNLNSQNLDALHDHLGTIYPGMRAPSFRCTDAEKGNNLILHYYSEREGLQDIVIGIIKTVAQQIHGTEIEMKVCRLFCCPSLSSKICLLNIKDLFAKCYSSMKSHCSVLNKSEWTCNLGIFANDMRSKLAESWFY